MSDQEQANLPHFHREGDAYLIDPQQVQIEAARRLREDEQHEFARKQVKTNRSLVVFTGLLVGCTLVGAVISIWQATISQTAANAAKDAAETAHQALIETRTGSGVQDTHTLAQQAVTQAIQTTNLAKATSTQAAEMRDSVRQASRLASATEKANANMVAADRPWIGGHIEVTNFELGKRPTVSTVFTNSGKRPAKVDVSFERSGFYSIFPFNPDSQFISNEGASTNILVPGQPTSMTSTSEGVLRQADLDLASGMYPFQTYFAFAKIEDRDLQTNESHFTHVCIYYISRLKTSSDPGFRNCHPYNEAN
jgi:hypothetical protein